MFSLILRGLGLYKLYRDIATCHGYILAKYELMGCDPDHVYERFTIILSIAYQSKNIIFNHFSLFDG